MIDKILKLLRENNDFIITKNVHNDSFEVALNAPHDNDDFHNIVAYIDENNEINYYLDDVWENGLIPIDMDHLMRLKKFCDMLVKVGE